MVPSSTWLLFPEVVEWTLIPPMIPTKSASQIHLRPADFFTYGYLPHSHPPSYHHWNSHLTGVPISTHIWTHAPSYCKNLGSLSRSIRLLTSWPCLPLDPGLNQWLTLCSGHTLGSAPYSYLASPYSFILTEAIWNGSDGAISNGSPYGSAHLTFSFLSLHSQNVQLCIQLYLFNRCPLAL